MAHTGPQGNAEEPWLMSEWPQEAGSPRWVFFPEGSRRTALEGHGPHNKLALLHVSHCPGGSPVVSEG